MLQPAKICLCVLLVLFGAWRAAADEADLAIVLLYDTSGSMQEGVTNGAGQKEPKFRIANRALESIVARLEKLQAERNRTVLAGLFTFSRNGGQPAVPIGPFDPAPLRNWLRNFQQPNGGTPLGNAVADATRALWNVKAGSRHVVVITDGQNSAGPPPEALIPGLQEQCLKNGLSVYFHFIAFDVDAKVFAGVKAFGSTLVSAGDEKQLNDKLGYILEEKIFLEKE
jgi:hypothetical protein